MGVFLFNGSVQAQNWSGLANSNFNGLNAVYINPAGIADARLRQHVNLVSFGTSFSNDYLTFEMPFSMRQLITGDVPAQYKNPDGSVKWESAWLKENLNGKSKNFNFNLEMRGPGFMTRITPKFAVALSTRTRFGLALTNLSEPMARYLKSQLDSNKFSVAGPLVSDNKFTINLNAVQEIGVSGAMVLMNRDALYLKAGVTGKMLFGLGSAYIKNNGIKFQQLPGDSLLIESSDIEVGHSNAEIIEKLANGNLSAVTPNFNLKGAGFGFDLGAIFEWRPEATQMIQSKNQYLLKAGVSLLDMGRIKYSTEATTYTASNSTPKIVADDSAFSAAWDQGIDSGLAYVERYARQHFNYQKGAGSFKSSIPSVLSVQLDYNVIKWLYVGLNWTQSFVSKSDIGLRRPSSLVIIPRFESRIFEASLPLAIYNDYKDFGVGAFLRVGPVFMGTDNLIKSINRSSFNGYDFYFGIAAGIPAGKKRKSSGGAVPGME